MASSAEVEVPTSSLQVEPRLEEVAEVLPAQKDHDYRSYANAPQHVVRFYHENHIKQTYSFALAQKLKYGALDSGFEMGIWEAAELLNELVDESDPDTSVAQIAHLLQTAEALRVAYPGEEYDWLHLTGFIHDLGKVLGHPKMFNQPQWAVVGDTFPTGCAYASDIIFSEFFLENADANHPVYSTKYGVYEPNCGLDNVVMSWGHDEYMYQVCVGNNCTLPAPALHIIRFHSFYAHHSKEAYTHLMNEHDREMLVWLRAFQKCDLYSKVDEVIDVDNLQDYYLKAIAKYFPKTLKW